ncbi:MAG TPA: FAD-binding protein [Devosiaceae bacterium]
MTILLLAEHDNAALSEQTARALTAARAVDADVQVLVAGLNARPAAESAARLEGVSKVLLAESGSLEHQLAEPLANLIVSLAGSVSGVVAAASSTGKNVLPRVAALLDVMQVSDVIAVESPTVFRRPIYAGNAVQTVESTDSFKVITVRTSGFTPAGESGGASIETIEVPGTAELSRFVGAEIAKSERPDLTAARIVVSGGRALGSREKFEDLIVTLADRLGAAVGASRAAVDSGYAPNDWQVGQTGKVVAPDLYIACGISGAIQHIAGMKDARVIVAINKDTDAPIFQIADYGLVADIFEAIPELVRQLG